MIGDDERQRDAALAGAGAHPHPPGREGGHRIGEAARPELVQGGGRTEHDRARQRGIALPLVVSDHADWDGLTTTIAATGASEIWVTHGEEEGLVRFCELTGRSARPLALVGYGEEEESTVATGEPP